MVQGPGGGQAGVKRVLEEVITRMVTAGANCGQAQLPPGHGGLEGAGHCWLACDWHFSCGVGTLMSQLPCNRTTVYGM